MSHEVQLSPAASNSPTAPPPSPAAHVTEAPDCRTRWPRTEAARQAHDIATPQKSGSSGHFSRPCHGSPAGAARWNRSARSRQVPGPPPRRTRLDPPRPGPATARRPRRSAGQQRTAPSKRTSLPAEPAPPRPRPRPADQVTHRHRPAMYLRCTCHRPCADLRRHRAGPAP